MPNIASRICSLCKSKHELIEKLNSDDGVKDIFIAIVDKERNDFRLNKSYLSFASKFIVCISKVLGTIYLNQYTKYDSIVSDGLPDYLGIYFNGNENFRSLEFKINRNLSPEEKWEKYKQYCKCVVALKDKVNSVEEGNPSFSLEELDHIIWFFGKKSLSI